MIDLLITKVIKSLCFIYFQITYDFLFQLLIEWMLNYLFIN